MHQTHKWIQAKIIELKINTNRERMEKYSRKAAGGKCKTSEKFGIASKTKGGQKNYKAIQEIPGKH